MTLAVGKLVDAANSRHIGTVFAVSSRLCLTAFHCVGDRYSGRVQSELVRCEWPGDIASSAVVYESDSYNDVALIRLDRRLPDELDPVVVATEPLDPEDFLSRGYPAEVPNVWPFVISGQIVSSDSQYEDSRVLQLRCNESMAELSLNGMSGSPVLVGNPPRAAGVIRRNQPRADRPHLATGGAAFAVPSSTVLARWPQLASTRPADLATAKSILRHLARRTRGRSATEVRNRISDLLLVGGLGLDENDLRFDLEIMSHSHCSIGIERGRALIEICPDVRSFDEVSTAESQINGYLKKQVKTKKSRFVGILTDGVEWRVYCRLNGTLRQVQPGRTIDPAKPDPEALLSWLETILATCGDIEPTPDTIRSKLGVNSPSYAIDSAELRVIYGRCRDKPSVRVKREMWAKLLTTASGSSFSDDDDLFVDHTLLVVIAEVIGHAMLDVDLEDRSLTAHEIVSGEQFAKRGIAGVVEPDFFDWIAEGDDGTRFIKDLARRLSRFAWGEVKHDVMKPLYQSIIPKDVRRRLGEYYTPDWLAQAVVARCVDDPISQQVLDPSCGSGTFLFYAIRRYLDAVDPEEENGPSVIKDLTKHVSGFDVQPVAVTLARVTYLLAIGKKRLQNRPRFGVPVYLCDSLRWGQQERIWSYKGLSVRTTLEHEDLLYDPEFIPDTDFDERLKFPDSVLANASNFNDLVSDLADRAVDSDKRRRISLTATFDRLGVAEPDRAMIERTFKNMCALHDDERDHIWGYYVRNLARPVWLARPDNRVDVLIGNPPWLTYRLMTDVQKQSFGKMIEDRAMQTSASAVTSQDLAALFVARCIELYLRPGGKFGYVMPRGTMALTQYERFRRGNFSAPTEEVAVAFSKPWDLRAIKPAFFKQPASVIFGRRAENLGTIKAMGRVVQEWSGYFDTEAATLADAEPHITRRDREIIPIGPSSPYKKEFFQGAAIVPQVLFLVEDEDQGWLGAGDGRRSVTSYRSNNQHEPWKSQESLHGFIEEKFIRHLYLGACILPFRPLQPREAVVPWDDCLIDEKRLDRYPGLAGWWRDAERAWNDKRSNSDLSLLQQLDYRRKLSQQFPMPQYRVVYPKSAMYCAAAIIDNTDHDDAVIDQQLYWGHASTLDEARFLAAVMNSISLTEAVQQIQPYGEHNPRDIAKYVFDLPIPKYDPQSAAHRELVRLAARAEHVAGSVDLPTVRFESLRRRVRGALVEDGVANEIDTIVDALLW